MQNDHHKKVTLPRPAPFLEAAHNPENPDPWQSLWLDQSTSINAGVKLAWLRDSNTWSRQFYCHLYVHWQG